MTIRRPKNSILLAVSYLLIFGFVQAKDYGVSGQVFDSNGDKAGKVTVLLLDNSELEVQSTKAKGNGKFKFKKVLSGEYFIRVDGGELGKANVPVTVSEDDIKDLQVSLQQTAPANVVKEEAPAATQVKKQSVAAVAPPINDGSLVPESAAEDERGDAGSTYIMNELSFEIKKLSAEVKHLSSELENLKSLSKMWVNPLAIYSKEIIMKNGSTIFGKIVYQDESELKVETLVGYLIIKRDNIVRVIDNVITEDTQEYVPEQVRDSYSPPPMPRLSEPKYTSADPLNRSAGRKYAANCVLVGNITEKKDNQGNTIFTGEVKNIGGRRADFVKMDFVFRKNWSGETKTLTTFARGTYHTFDSGITTDATLLPGAVGAFELYVPHAFGSFIGYSYVIDWEEYE
ncbi:MAG: hypothetical protein CMG19_05355 [Candidatus Marinimicrobia bacterium]|nr:hypothetical protein [Candidatus Neomarinimicrobiota bacterium]